MKKDLVLLIAVSTVIIAFAAFFLFAPKAPELAYAPVDVGGGSITVDNQNQFDYVVLDTYLAKAGWITIHESLSDAPAKVIGVSQYLEKGEYKDLKIQVSPKMIPGYKYITLLHVDNGDEEFYIDDDYPVKVDDLVIRPDFIAVGEDGDDTLVDLPGTDITITPEE